jgi:hypothetical protein
MGDFRTLAALEPKMVERFRQLLRQSRRTERDGSA